MDKIICVGKNYLAHAIELGDAVPEKPVLFLKPPSVLKQAYAWGETLQATFPGEATEIVHPEVELVLQLAHGGYRLNHEQAPHCINAVTIGLDMTLRTTQTLLKKQSHPWTIGKVFPDAAIIGPWIALSDMTDYLQQSFSASINDRMCQQAMGQQMMMPPIELIVYISHYFPLCAGDIIFTGTPEGISELHHHDCLHLSLRDYAFSVQF